MNVAQRRWYHEQHQHHDYLQQQQQPQQQRAQAFATNYPGGPSSFEHASAPSLASSFGAGGASFHGANASYRAPLSVSASPQRPSALGIGSGLGLPQVGPTDETLLYTSQPSRAVLSALRTLQDKLQELRVEKSGLENALAAAQQQASTREHELQRSHERALAESVRRAAEFEASYLAKLREARESEERAQAALIRAEGDVRALKEQASSRDADLKAVRDEVHSLRLQLNDAELSVARAEGSKKQAERDSDLERAAAAERDLEIVRLRGELADAKQALAHQTSAADVVKQTLVAAEAGRRAAEGDAQAAHDTIASLTHELRVVSGDLMTERRARQRADKFKYLTREYAQSLLNLNYEMCIDVGMNARKRNELLQHAQQLLQGLKKAAWAADEEDAEAEADAGGAGADGNGPASPARRNGGGVTIDGVSTSIDEQRYLLAGASSPEAIRVLHPDRRGNEDSDDEQSSSRRRSSSRGRSRSSSRGRPSSGRNAVSAAPTVASTAKARAARASFGGGAGAHHHTLNKEIALPFTVGKSAKQSFSVPVNVQEILSKQPAYYTRLAQRQVAQAAKRKAAGAGDDERVVYPPLPAHGQHSVSFAGVDSGSADESSSSESTATHGAAVSLSAHQGGLRVVIAHLEAEVEALNRDYVFHLDQARDHGAGNRTDESGTLDKKLQTILRQIETSNKKIEALRSHLDSLEGGSGQGQSQVGSRLYSASTAASRSGRASSSATPAVHKASVPLTLVPAGAGPRATPLGATAHSSVRRASLSRKAPAPAAASSIKKKRPSTASAGPSSSTDLTDRHAHHQHGTQSGTPRRARAGLRLGGDDDEDGGGDASGGLPHFGFLSPNSQRLLHKKMQSMRLLGQFKAMFDESEHDGQHGDAAKRFGAD
jgi:uncharacterized protein YaaR (DUF327 family)